MQESPIRIPADDGQIFLEGLFHEGTASRNAVLCHPHPLYGGNMDNNVVIAARNAFAACGWGTLRFNFHGVGRSQGRPGEDERAGEDLLAAARHLHLQKPGAPLDIAGYSYGAWAALKAIRNGLDPGLLCLFSPPLDFMSFEGLALPDIPILITLGNQDDFCSVESLRKWLYGQQAKSRVTLEIFPYCDHFYWEFGNELRSRITAFLTKNCPQGPGQPG